MKENTELLQRFSEMGIDIPFLIQESFLGYKYRRNNKKMRISDDNIPTTLIKMYYSFHSDDIVFDKMKKAFVSRYVLNESKLE